MQIIEITFLIIGSCIGAGFATGAEIAAFFSRFNLPSFTIGFFVFIALTTLISLIAVLTGRTKSSPKFLNAIFIVVYFTLFVAMTAGITEIAGIWTSLLSLIISIITVLFGFDKMAKFNTVIVCFIIVILLTVCLPYINKIPNISASFNNSSPNSSPYNLLFWSFLYAGLNCCMLDEIIKVANQKTAKRNVIFAVIIAAAIISAFVYLILNAVTATNTQNVPMPFYFISHNSVTFVIIILAILTSQFSALFAITQKMENFNPHRFGNTQKMDKSQQIDRNYTDKRRKKTAVITTASLAFICSFIGFSKLIETFYPIIGLIFLIYLPLSFLLPRLSSLRKR